MCNYQSRSILPIVLDTPVRTVAPTEEHWETAQEKEGMPTTNPTVERVVRRRLALWPDRESRVAAARMYDEGASLAEVLRRYPDGAVARRPEGGEPARPERRAIYAHWALLQEIQGQPDTDPDDGVAVKRIIAAEGFERAAVRTGSALTRYGGADRPNLEWYRRQAPPQWQHEYERAVRGA